jgi:hypothetical protein
LAVNAAAGPVGGVTVNLTQLHEEGGYRVTKKKNKNKRKTANKKRRRNK